ncbi:MAG: YebC/PmpR family DNA-binding transcriptional regulator [Candidatus Omnitrophica bacterium]|nr:YebC/PmpR family DNA-binding transcriptional regulator [Candidatus Omnitrophota bacterium]
MSGHSKWAGIKHKKAIIDAKRGKLFSKLVKEITISARDGGGDIAVNARLRQAIQKAKEANVPADNIERAVKKGTGELPGVSYEDVVYEGYGPGGVAVLVEAATDNKNRSSAEIRRIFNDKNGNLAGSGSVSWQFTKKGVVLVSSKEIEEDKLMTIVLDAGAEDLKEDDGVFEIITDIKDFEAVKKVLDDNNIKTESDEITMIPKSYIKLDGSHAEQLLNLIEALDDQEDVQHVYANFDIPDEILQKHF